MTIQSLFRGFGGLAAVLRVVREGSERDPAELFRIAASSPFPPLQLESEFVPFLSMVKEHRPSTLLEIGTCKGGSLFLFARVLPSSAHLISIDLPGGPNGGGFPAWKSPIFRRLVQPEQTLTLLRADSHSGATLQEVERQLAGRPLDILFIDGDHSYEGVKGDFTMYSNHVRPGGMVVLHDIVEGRMAGEVHKFWNEIKSQYAHTEIVEDWSQGACGLGILWMGTPAR